MEAVRVDKHNHSRIRSLNQSWDDTKEIAGQTYEGFKNTVTKNMVLSITLSVTVLSLLILCCYLRRKCRRDAQVISRSEYNNLVATREERNRTMKELREQKKADRRLRRKNKNEVKHSEHTKADAGAGVGVGVGAPAVERNRNVGVERQEEDEGNLANLSLETTDTRETAMSADDIDIEVGNDGAVEIEFSPGKSTMQEI